jgi:hypothetical protein
MPFDAPSFCVVPYRSRNGVTELPRPHSLHRYRLVDADGSDAGEANYPVAVTPGTEIISADGRHLRVIDVVAVEDEDSPVLGLLRFEEV